jgi:hypothetical protein
MEGTGNITKYLMRLDVDDYSGDLKQNWKLDVQGETDRNSMQLT